MDQRAQEWERRFTAPIIAAALLVIPVLMLEAVDASGPWRTVGQVGDWLIWLVFLAEVVVMLAVVPDRRRWLLEHPLDVAIVVLTPPFVTGALQSLRVLRILRVVRLLRVAALARSAFSLAGLRWAFFLAVITAVAGGAAFAEAEGEPFGVSLYWALTTMTTVGYGDVTPDTNVGRAVSVAVMLVGIGFFAVLTGAVAERFLASDTAQGESAEHAEVRERLDRIEAALANVQQQPSSPRR